MADVIYGTDSQINSATSKSRSTIQHFYDRAGVKSATRNLIYSQFADRKSMPLRYGKTYKISRWLPILDDRNALDTTSPALGIDTKGDPSTRINLYGSSRNYNDVTTSMPSLSEGAGRVNRVGVTKITMETQFSRYGAFIDYTDELEMFHEDVTQIRYREELGVLANELQDDLLQKDMLATTCVLYAGSATSKSEIGINSTTSKAVKSGVGGADTLGLTYDLIRKAGQILTKNKATKRTSIITGSTKIDTRAVNKCWSAIIGPEVKWELETLVDKFNQPAFIPAYKYADAGTLMEGEVGAVHDTRFVESERALIFNATGAAVEGTDSYFQYSPDIAGTNKVDVFPIIYPTEGAFATVGLQGEGKIKFNAISPDNKELGNPYSNKGLFSMSFWYASIILQPEKLLVIHTPVKNGANAYKGTYTEAALYAPTNFVTSVTGDGKVLVNGSLDLNSTKTQHLPKRS